jgi:hypothetical protein
MSNKKWLISIYAVVVFVLVSNKYTYDLTNNLRLLNQQLATVDEFGNPTVFGFALHTLVFFLLVRAMMEVKLPGINSDDALLKFVNNY